MGTQRGSSPSPSPLRCEDIGIAAIALALGGRLDRADDENGRVVFYVSGAPADVVQQITASPTLRGIIRWLPQLAGIVRTMAQARRRGPS